MTKAAARDVDGEPLCRARSGGGLLLLAAACCISPAVAGAQAVPPSGWDGIVASEEAILQVAPQIKRLNQSILNLRLPDETARSVFGDFVDVVDLTRVDLATEGPLGTVRFASVAGGGGPAAVSREELGLWRPLLDGVEYFEHAKFHVIRGHLLDQPEVLETELGFEGLARWGRGDRIWLKGELTVRWAAASPSGADGTPTWSIVGWETDELRTMSTALPLFADVLDHALAPEALVAARRSIHEELVLEYLLDPDGFESPTPFFDIPASDRHPGVSVTDLDRDGHDDVYVMAQWGKNQFFRNRGDGTFEEIAGRIGLDVESHTSSALFADFDNDGDSDVFLGRTLLPSVYLVNEGGRFVDRSAELVDGPLPAHVSAVSAADYDGDGLLDLYVSTYAASMLPTELLAYLPEADGLELWRLRASAEDHVIKNRFGPPNVLLKNLGGGRFAPVEGSKLKLFKNSYQATWADYDNDGDMDVYVASDFAPNNLYRNDGAAGFSDVTEETGTEDLGFGMGASWGDFDGDGLQDLYVTNMYSKAGMRITEQLNEADPRFRRMARGNTLFKNRGSTFERVSGLEPPGLLVEAAGWGWGGQFVDLDNDADLDIYTLSGYYTAPSAVELPIDI